MLQGFQLSFAQICGLPWLFIAVGLRVLGGLFDNPLSHKACFIAPEHCYSRTADNNICTVDGNEDCVGIITSAINCNI